MRSIRLALVMSILADCFANLSRDLLRVSAFIITRADQVTPDDVNGIESHLRRHNSAAPIFRASHEFSSVVDSGDAVQPIATLRGKKVFAFCGIGSPQAFFSALRSHIDLLANGRFRITPRIRGTDITALASAAKASGAICL